MNKALSNFTASGRKFLIAGLLLVLLPAIGFSQGYDEDEPLDPEDAFRSSAEMVDRDHIRIDWDIAEGYYLYHDKFHFKNSQDGVKLGAAEIPDGKEKNDEFFGTVITHRGQFSIDLPVTLSADFTGPLDLEIRSQGCADLGLCYPPHGNKVSLTVPAASTASAATPALPKQKPSLANALSALASLDGLNQDKDSGGGLGSEDEFLDADDAFRLIIDSAPNGEIIARWDIADGYYLYQDKFKFELLDAPGRGQGTPVLSQAQEKNDPNLGLMMVYHKQAEARLPITGNGETQAKLKVTYQGCAEAGLCYPPINKTIPVILPAKATSAATAATTPDAATNIDTAHETAAASSSTTDAPPISEQDQLANALASGGWLTVLSFFGFGLLLAFTPCVFPMIPILSSIIVGQGDKLSTRRAFLLSLIYVLAMAVTYTVAGVLAGLFGGNLQAAFQDPLILIAFSLVFVALALSMFGFYEIQLPNSVQSRLSQISNQQKGGTIAGVAIMGFLSALIVGPCVAPPLAGALIYISQTGDAVLGGTALFALSMGMGAPLIAIGTSAGKLLPRAGGWMDSVKAVFGVMMLGVSIWMLERIVPAQITMALVGTLLIASGIYMGALEPLHHRHIQSAEPSAPSGWHKLWKSLGLVLVIYGVLQFVGIAANGKDYMQPLRGVSLGGGVSSAGASVLGHDELFTKIKSSEDLNQAIKQANGKPVMLDFYADWCVACKEMEKYSFTDPGVQAAMANMVVLQADVTDNDEVDQALMKRFGVIGPPSILYFGPDGQERKAYRVVGEMGPSEFRDHTLAAIK